MHMNNCTALYPLITFYNALYLMPLSKVLLWFIFSKMHTHYLVSLIVLNTTMLNQIAE